MAKKHGIYLLIGSIAEKVPNNDNKCYNTSVFFNPKGELIAKYQKCIFFDVDVPGGLCIKESDSIISGDDLVVVETELGMVGLSICYDLRFPEMFRSLVDRGAEIIVVPSAFTLTTGKDHWMHYFEQEQLKHNVGSLLQVSGVHTMTKVFERVTAIV